MSPANFFRCPFGLRWRHMPTSKPALTRKMGLPKVASTNLRLSSVWDGHLGVEGATLKSGLCSKEWGALPGSPTAVCTTGRRGRCGLTKSIATYRSAKGGGTLTHSIWLGQASLDCFTAGVWAGWLLAFCFLFMLLIKQAQHHPTYCLCLVVNGI